MQLAADPKRNRADLATKRDHAATALASLNVERAGIEVQADLGRLAGKRREQWSMAVATTDRR